MPLARTRGHLWSYSLEPLRQPLLKQVHDKADLRDIACQIFLDILPYQLPALPTSLEHRHCWPVLTAGLWRARSHWTEHRAEPVHTHGSAWARPGISVGAALGISGSVLGGSMGQGHCLALVRAQPRALVL